MEPADFRGSARSRASSTRPRVRPCRRSVASRPFGWAVLPPSRPRSAADGRASTAARVAPPRSNSRPPTSKSAARPEPKTRRTATRKSPTFSRPTKFRFRTWLPSSSGWARAFPSRRWFSTWEAACGRMPPNFHFPSSWSKAKPVILLGQDDQNSGSAAKFYDEAGKLLCAIEKNELRVQR